MRLFLQFHFPSPPSPGQPTKPFLRPRLLLPLIPIFRKKELGDERKKESQKMHFSASFPPTFFSYHHPSHRFATHNQEGIVVVFFSVGVILSPLLSTASLLLRLILAVVFSGKVVAFQGLQRNFANVCGKFPARKKPSYLSGPTSSTERMRRGTTEQRKVMISREEEKGFPSPLSLSPPTTIHGTFFPPHKKVLRGRASLPFPSSHSPLFPSLPFSLELKKVGD